MAGLFIKHYGQNLHKKTLPAGECTLAFLTDFHNGSRERAGMILEGLAHARPDLVLIGGDMLTALPGLSYEPALYLIDALRERFKLCYAFGNHEYRMMLYKDTYQGCGEAYLSELLKRDITVLRNDSVSCDVKGLPLRITGFELPAPFYKKFKKHHFPAEEIEKLVGPTDSSSIQVLLAHNPVFCENYLDWGADLTLCGHMHGGIVRIFGHPLIGTDGHFFPRYGYGRVDAGEKSVYISAGLGEHTFPLRIANPRELILVTLKNHIT